LLDPLVLREAEEVARRVTRHYLLGDFGADDALLTLELASFLVLKTLKPNA